MTINLDTLRKRAGLPNALHGCTSNPCGSVVCQTARDRDELLSRLEQAEQAVQRVREALSDHPRTCDQHTEDDPVKCGWKRAVIDVQDALDGDGRG